jgi:copper oxidase (laccase) domain-containing protein
MEQHFGARPEDLFVGVGPAIRGPSYEVGPEVAGLFPEEFAVPVDLAGSARRDVSAGGDRFLLDLPSCVLAEARAAGVPRDNLVDFALCTRLHPGDLFSHRRGDGGRHWAFIGRP